MTDKCSAKLMIVAAIRTAWKQHSVHPDTHHDSAIMLADEVVQPSNYTGVLFDQYGFKFVTLYREAAKDFS